jgi:hypothetical protein
MTYLPPFDVIKRSIEISTSRDGQVFATARYENLLDMIRSLLSVVNVDEKWYLTQYPDVAEAIAQGIIPSAKDHFVVNGYFEGRLPALIAVDERFYLTKYPDVAESVRKGTEKSGQGHFLEGGYREGRMPRPA